MKRNKNNYELSRPLKVDGIPRGGIEEKIVARDKERQALIKRFDLKDLSRFEAMLNVDHGRDRMFTVRGHLRADVVLSCVVTLEPVELTVREDIDIFFAPKRMISSAEDMTELGDWEQPEPIEGGIIDLGELLVQYFAAALPLYPRKEGACLDSDQPKAVSDKGNNPFVALKNVVKITDKTQT